MDHLRLSLIMLLGISTFTADYPRVTNICTVAPDVIDITVMDGHVQYGKQVPGSGAGGL